MARSGGVPGPGRGGTGHEWRGALHGPGALRPRGKASPPLRARETASFFYEFELLQDVEVPTAGVELVSDKGIIVHGKSTLEYGSEVPENVRRGRRLRVRQDIALELASGEYTFNLGLGALSRHDYDRRAHTAHGELDARLARLCLLPGAGTLAVALRRAGAPVQLIHHGVANLRGSCRMFVAGSPRRRRSAPNPVRRRPSRRGPAATMTDLLACWCGNASLVPFGPGYARCPVCETLVSVEMPASDIAHVVDEDRDFYGREYWFSYQQDHLRHPTIVDRARSDLPERCLYWLQVLLEVPAAARAGAGAGKRTRRIRRDAPLGRLRRDRARDQPVGGRLRARDLRRPRAARAYRRPVDCARLTRRDRPHGRPRASPRPRRAPCGIAFDCSSPTASW